jgi:trimeric autotransporter adhesin
MAVNHIHNCIGRFLLACLAVSGLLASEHHGVVKSGGLPVPGATVTATMGDKKQLTTTDDQGAYGFTDLEDGNWTITIEMLGFDKVTKEVGVMPSAPSPTFEMNLLSADGIKAAVAARLAPPPTAAPATTPAATPAAPTTAPAPATTAAGPATTTPAATPGRSGNGTQSAAGRGNGGGRAGGANGATGANGRPSIRGAQQNGFQRADVTQQADVSNVNPGADMNMGNADMSQSADAIVAVGSVNSGLGMPQQNDWGGGRGMDGMGGPMGGFGMGGDGTGMPGQFGADGGGAGGPGGGGRGGPGGGGPGGGGARGGGGFGGGGMMPMAPGGRGGRGGAPGGRGGRGGPGGRGNLASFGNGRRGSRPRYNGNLAFVLDNSALDARAYSISGADTAKAAYAKARITASGGGPLKIPHVISGDKTTFFLNYQLGRNRNGSNATGLMPTADERNGDFSQAISTTGKPITIFDPKTGIPYPNNLIPTNLISKQASSLMSLYPLPNFPANARFNYQVPIVGISNQDNISTRLNHTISQKDQINGGLGYQRNDGTTPNLFGFIDNSKTAGWNANASWIHHFTNRLMSTARYTYSRQNRQALPYFANGQNIAGQAGILGTNQDPLYYGPPSLSFTNFAGLNDGNPSVDRNQTQSVGDTVMYIRGLHTVQVGGDFRRQQINNLSQQTARGAFSFNGTATQQLINGVGVNGSGYDFADFLLGYADTTNIAFGNADKYFRTSWYDAFVNDDWRVSTKLTLVTGLRWEYGAPITELYGRLVNLAIGPAYSSISPVCGALVANTSCTATGSQAGLPSSLVNPYKGAIEPRIGFAFRPFTKASTLLRGGYGIYYNTSVYTSIANQMAQQSPISTSARLSSTPGSLLTMATGLLVPANVTTNTFAIDPNFHIGYTQNWQFAVQQNLKWSLVATATYSGSKGTRLPQQFLPNSVPSGYSASNPLVPGPYGPSGYTYETSNGNNTYNSAVFGLQRRFRSGFSGNINYVFSKAIDDALGNVVAQNWLNLDGERARSSGIRTQTANFQMQYSTGVGTRGGTLLKGWKGTLIKDWTVSTNIAVGSGIPLTVTVPATVKGTGVTGSERPNLTGAAIYGVPGSNLNPLAFVAPAPGTWGSLGRNTLIGPGLFSLNGQASRTIRIGERRSADLQFQANNLLNHVTFPTWNTTLGSTQFGLPVSASGMRVIQATLRFRF